jgi:hypothetical protein
VSRNQIDISPDLIDFDFINFARYPKATNEEFASTIVVCDGLSVTQINHDLIVQ